MATLITNPVRSPRISRHDPFFGSVFFGDDFFGDALSRVFGDNVFASAHRNSNGRNSRRNTRRNNDNGAERSISPRTDIYESDTAFALEVDLPGVNKDAIEVNVTEGVLSITAKYSDPESAKDTTTRRQERFRGCFFRQFSVGDNIDENAIAAQYAGGVLKLTLPKRTKPAVNARRIEIH